MYSIYQGSLPGVKVISNFSLKNLSKNPKKDTDIKSLREQTQITILPVY